MGSASRSNNWFLTNDDYRARNPTAKRIFSPFGASREHPRGLLADGRSSFTPTVARRARAGVWLRFAGGRLRIAAEGGERSLGTRMVHRPQTRERRWQS